MTPWLVCVFGLFRSFYIKFSFLHLSGHKSLWLKGILHRDVSIDNILLGCEGAPEGYRGILIDLDMAIKISPTRRQLGRFRTVSIFCANTGHSLTELVLRELVLFSQWLFSKPVIG